MRYYIISETRGLVARTDDWDEAEYLALTTAVNTARTVYLHDREDES